jgi:hypothetical protein
MKTQKFTLTAAIALTVCTTGSVSAAIIDDFSTNQSGSYTQHTIFKENGHASLVFNTANGQFAPTSAAGTNYTYDVFYRNTGEVFRAAGGETASIDIVSVSSQQAVAGLGFGLSTTGNSNTFQTFIRHDGSNYFFQYQNNGGGADLSNTNLTALNFDLATSPATLAVSRDAVNPALFNITVTGGGMATPFTTSITPSTDFSGQDLFFGMVNYTGYGGAAAPAVQDNLSFTAVPEPSTALALLGGTASLLAMRRRRA